MNMIVLIFKVLNWCQCFEFSNLASFL